jgi:nucleotide-binding universal stress UspA family protein
MKILIATDGSEFSRAAIKGGCEIAKGQEPVAVRVISVYEPQQPMATEPFTVSAEHYATLNALAKRRAEDRVNNALELIRKGCDEPKIEISSVIELGKPAEAIIEAAKNWDADLIVMGSHGHGFWGRLTLGSVSDAVVHHAPCSVLIVKLPKVHSLRDC